MEQSHMLNNLDLTQDPNTYLDDIIAFEKSSTKDS